MSDDELVTIPEPSQSIFTHLLNLWASYRRIVIIAVLTTALAEFYGSFSTESKAFFELGLLAHRGLIALLLVFSLVTLSLLWSAGQRLDTWIFILLNVRGHHPMWLDRIMWGFTQIGNGILGIFAGIFLYYMNLKRLAIDLILGILSLWLIVEILKILVERRRPFIAMQDTRVIGWRERGLSFPSGHTAQTFFMASLLAQYLQAGVFISLILYGVALTVAFTRIYVGAHYPRDVIGGAVLGSVWGILSGIIQAYIITGRF